MHKALGRGLEVLIPQVPGTESKLAGDSETDILIGRIVPNKNQPRKHFDEEKLNELTRSIKKHGIAQSLLVKPSKISGEFELIAGERRLRAAKKAGLKRVPVIIRDVSDTDRVHLSLVENLQREDLNPIEQAQAFKSLMEQNNHTQEEISELLALSRSKIANTLRLLSLPGEIRDLISRGMIPSSQARALVAVEDENTRKEIAARIINEKLTTREVERLASDWKQAIATKKVKIAKRKNPEIRSLEESLQRSLGTKVQINNKRKGGSIRIEYYSNDDLERILDIIRGKKNKK